MSFVLKLHVPPKVHRKDDKGKKLIDSQMRPADRSQSMYSEFCEQAGPGSTYLTPRKGLGAGSKVRLPRILLQLKAVFRVVTESLQHRL